MSNPETIILQEIRLFCAALPGVILFRNAIGYDNRAKQDYGIMNPGGPDLIGWVQYDLRAVFLAIEVKTATGVVSPDQRARIKLIRESGGLAGVARSTSDAQRIINGEIVD